MPENVKTVKPGGGGDYSSVQTWEAALSANPTDDQVAECYEGDCLGGSSLVMDVSNSSNVRLVIRAASGERFRDQSEWATSMYAAVGHGAWLGAGAGSINVDTNDVFIEDMGVRLSNSGHYFGVSGEVTLNRCFVYRTRLQANRTDDLAQVGDARIWNTVWVTYGAACIWARESGSSVEVINSVVAEEPGQAGELGVWKSSGALTVRNTWSIGFDGGTCFNTPTSGDYNGSSDGSAPGTNYRRNITIADWFVANGATTFDYHLKPAKFGEFVGTDESATIGGTDIDGQARSQSDVGADAEVAAPSVTRFAGVSGRSGRVPPSIGGVL